jgi:2-methylisocitrate lyase-like PEP mutase family enzyme
LLVNCWDAGSARIISEQGAEALATTSAGIAWAHGYPDGNALPVDRLVSSVRAIARVIRIPLTADIESGYSHDPSEVGELVARLIDVGVVGVNIEDGQAEPAVLAEKIGHVARAGVRTGVGLFVNARTDVYLKRLAPEPARVAETLARAKRYGEAGANGIFVPGLIASAEIREIASACGLPLNVLARPGLPSASDLAALGVRRVSTGSAIPQSLWSQTARLAKAFLTEGRSEPLYEGATAHSEINASFTADNAASVPATALHLATEPRLAGVLEELRAREPIFHRPELGTTRADFEAQTAADFWEVGASGRCYSREFVLATLTDRWSHPHDDPWTAGEFHCRELAEGTYALTYRLQQRERVTRRLTIWRNVRGTWTILFHQGTVVSP